MFGEKKTQEELLRIERLTTVFRSGGLKAAAVEEVSLEIRRGEALGLVGESGSGKSALALSVLRLVPDPPGRVVSGAVFFRGKDLLRLPPRDLRRVRGRSISLVFQNPQAAMNPLFTVGDQIAEAVIIHEGKNRREAHGRAVETMARTGIPAPGEAALRYPHQLSGGLLQRAMIAMALVCGPDLLIADEPTSSLDVTIQAQILDLLDRLGRDEKMSLLLISHNFGILAGICDRIAVMYAARIVEEAPTRELFERPLHPYTAGLLRSLPGLSASRRRLANIPGAVPSLFDFPRGCRFHPRCSIARDLCRTEEPFLTAYAPGHRAACHFAGSVV